MIAFLIDADNFSFPEWIDAAFKTIDETAGNVHIRRAYGRPENLKRLEQILRTQAVRPFVNFPLPENTTNVSLAIDAMELACSVPKLGLIVIGSGKPDYLDLVLRLRERGITVWCVSHPKHTALEAIHAYDRVLYVQANQPKLQNSSELIPTVLVDFKGKLLNAMALLELVEKSKVSMDHFPLKYGNLDLIGAAHDLVQNVHSNFQSPLSEKTHEIVRALEAARISLDRIPVR